MAHDRNAAPDEEGGGLRHMSTAFHLDGTGHGFLENARGIAESLLGAFLIGAERHVDDDQRLV